MLIQDLSRQASIELLGRTRLYRLACAHEGQPYVTPMHCVYDSDYLYAFSTLGQKITWMRANPLVCVLAEEMVSTQDWASVIVFGTYEELTDTTQCEAYRQRAFDLLQTRPIWWEPGYVETVVDGKMRLMESLYFRIHIDQISGHRGTPDTPVIGHAPAARGNARWFRKIFGRSEPQAATGQNDAAVYPSCRSTHRGDSSGLHWASRAIGLAGSINDGLGLGDVCTQILEWAPQRAYAPHAWERLPLHLAQNDANSDAYGFNPFSGVLTITAGTGKLRHAQGSLTFAAQAGPTAPYATNPGMFNNNFVLNAYYAVQGTIEM